MAEVKVLQAEQAFVVKRTSKESRYGTIKQKSMSVVIYGSLRTSIGAPQQRSTTGITEESQVCALVCAPTAGTVKGPVCMSTLKDSTAEAHTCRMNAERDISFRNCRRCPLRSPKEDRQGIGLRSVYAEYIISLRNCRKVHKVQVTSGHQTQTKSKPSQN